MSQYTTLPSSATLRPTPFEVKISDATLEELKILLKFAKLPPDTYENTKEDGQYGVSNNWIRDAKTYWETKFNWRKNESRINSFPNYTAPVLDTSSGNVIQVHFVSLFSLKPDAIPVLLLHGWPGSFLEFLPTLDILREKYTPETLPYHLVVPSLPGYAFSECPKDKDMTLEDVAGVVDKLAIGLGFGSGYMVQGGDIGSRLARIIAAEYPGCKAVHLNYCIIPQPRGSDLASLDEADRRGIESGVEFRKFGSAYAIAHATRPATIGIVLSSSPLALLAWIGEKFLSWTDESPSLDMILESITLYWVTDTIARSLYPYRQTWIPGGVSTHENPRYYLHKPFGYSLFPKEIAPIPREWVATTGKLVWFRRHEKGGHFAAMEQPEALLDDLEEFVKEVVMPLI